MAAPAKIKFQKFIEISRVQIFLYTHSIFFGSPFYFFVFFGDFCVLNVLMNFQELECK